MKKNHIKKASVIGLVVIISLVMISTSGIAEDASIRGVIGSFVPPGEDTDGSITIDSPYYGSITLNIAPGSLTPFAIAWIYAAMINGWPVEAFYDAATMYLTALFIYPIFAPYNFFALKDSSFNHYSHQVYNV
jgi:hypothetical protein